METLQAISTRTSVRKFLYKEVPIEVIKTVIEAGIRAPSGGNRQPWRFVVVTDKNKIRAFDPQYHQACVEKAPAVIVVCANPYDTWEKYDENEQCYILDTAAATQNMLLAIHDQGLGGVWVISFSNKAVREQLNIPLHWKIISIVPFGYCEGNDVVRPRKRMEEVAFLNDINCPIK